MNLSENLEGELFGGVSGPQLEKLKQGKIAISACRQGFTMAPGGCEQNNKLDKLNKLLRTTVPPRTMAERLAGHQAKGAGSSSAQEGDKEDSAGEGEEESGHCDDEIAEDSADDTPVNKKPAASKVPKNPGASKSAQANSKAKAKGKAKPKATPKAKGKKDAPAKSKAKAKKGAQEDKPQDGEQQTDPPAPPSPPPKKLSMSEKLASWRAHGLDSVQNTPIQGAQPSSSSHLADAHATEPDIRQEQEPPQAKGSKSAAKTKEQLAQYAKKRAFDAQFQGLPEDIKAAYELCNNKKQQVDFVNSRFVKDEKTGDMDVSLLFCLASTEHKKQLIFCTHMSFSSIICCLYKFIVVAGAIVTCVTLFTHHLVLRKVCS